MTEFHRFKVGGITAVTLKDGQITRQADTLFNNVSIAEINPVLAANGLARDAIPSWFDPLYLDTGQHKVMIDTGNGAEHGGQVIASLKAAGINPANIDTVILTHAHGGHICGNTTPEGTLTFPNARYYIGREEWKYWTSNDVLDIATERAPLLRKNLLNIKKAFTLVEGETEIVPGIRTISTPGHTPGHLALLVVGRLLNVGGALHHPLHAEHPEWLTIFDSEPERVPAARRKLMEMAVERKLLVYGYHFPFPGYGRVTPNGTGWKWKPGM
ncbi:MAG: MBL fold metallo-hydrolase [Anaerolineaceae bacterium]|nr:MBL fold metallo-hydrolase [Anaerolineaceae bacterium]